MKTDVFDHLNIINIKPTLDQIQTSIQHSKEEIRVFELNWWILFNMVSLKRI
jgi:hypothetical protein